LTDICWIDDKKSRLKHVLRARNVPNFCFKFPKVMQQHTYLRYGRYANMYFVGNLALFAAVKEFCKSITNWLSYGHG